MTSTKAYDKKTAAFIGFLIQNVPTLSNEQMTEWMENPSALKNILNELVQGVPSTGMHHLFFSHFHSWKLAAISSKLTAECCERWMTQFNGFDDSQWFMETQPSTPACTVTAFVPKRKRNVVEFAQAVLGTRETDLYTLSNEIIARGHSMTLAQAEKLGEDTAREEVTGLVITEVDKLENKGFLLNRDLSNFFLLETGDVQLPLMVGRVTGNDENDWDMGMYGFNETVEFGKTSRFLIRNWKK